MDKTIRQNHREMRSKPFSVRLQYFWSYGKWHVITGILILMMLFSIISSICTYREPALTGLFINAYEMEQAEQMKTEFAQYAQIEPETLDGGFSTAYFESGVSNDNATLTQQYITTHIANGSLDLLAIDEENFQNANAEMFVDLRTVFSAEELERLKSRIVWAEDEPGTTAPIAISIEDIPAFTKAYALPQGRYLLCICVNTEHIELIRLFVNYLVS